MIEYAKRGSAGCRIAFVHFRVPRAERRGWCAEARRRRKSLSSFVRDVVRAELERVERERDATGAQQQMDIAQRTGVVAPPWMG